MAELSDEILMARIDGELSPAECAQVDVVLSGDPAARARLTVFEATRAPLADLFQATASEPVPRHLVELVHSFPVAAAVARGDDGRPPEKRRSIQRARPPQIGAGWYSALAYSTALLVGIGGGWYLHETAGRAPIVATTQVSGQASGQAQLLATHGEGWIVAAGALHTALETAPGGVPITASQGDPSGARIETPLTFKSKQGFCRQYELALKDRKSFAGIGCRGSDGIWVVQSHFEVPQRSANELRIGVAAARKILAAIVDSMSDGDALGAPEEKTLIERKWKD